MAIRFIIKYYCYNITCPCTSPRFKADLMSSYCQNKFLKCWDLTLIKITSCSLNVRLAVPKQRLARGCPKWSQELWSLLTSQISPKAVHYPKQGHWLNNPTVQNRKSMKMSSFFLGGKVGLNLGLYIWGAGGGVCWVHFFYLSAWVPQSFYLSFYLLEVLCKQKMNWDCLKEGAMISTAWVASCSQC